MDINSINSANTNIQPAEQSASAPAQTSLANRTNSAAKRSLEAEPRTPPRKRRSVRLNPATQFNPNVLVYPSAPRKPVK